MKLGSIILLVGVAIAAGCVSRVEVGPSNEYKVIMQEYYDVALTNYNKKEVWSKFGKEMPAKLELNTNSNIEVDIIAKDFKWTEGGMFDAGDQSLHRGCTIIIGIPVAFDRASYVDKNGIGGGVPTVNVYFIYPSRKITYIGMSSHWH